MILGSGVKNRLKCAISLIDRRRLQLIKMPKSKKYPLHLVLTALFAVLILIVGSLIGVLSYTQIKKLLFSAADEIYEKVSAQVVLSHRVTYNPVRNAIKLLSYSLVTDHKTVASRLKHLNELVAVLEMEKPLVSIQLAYGDGGYLIVRKLNSNALKSRFKAPEGTSFVVDIAGGGGEDEQRMEKRPDNARFLRLFFDNQLKLVQQNAPAVSQYDPRTRLWYKQVVAHSVSQGKLQPSLQPSVIDPYYLDFVDKIGTTISMRVQHSDTVVAADIALESISQSLLENKMTPHSELYLVEANGNVVVSSNVGEILISRHAGRVVFKKIHELQSRVFSGLPDVNLYREQSFSFYMDGKYWKGAAKKIGQPGGESLYLFMFSPVSELLKDAIRIGWNTLFLLFFIILLTVPLIWYVSKRISVDMQQLAANAREIMRFNFDTSAPLKSRIKEVDDLFSAQTLMKESLSRFMDLINSLASEKDFDSLLDKITAETLSANNADAVFTYLLDADNENIVPSSIKTRSETESEGMKSGMPVFSLKGSELIAEFINSNDCGYLIQEVNKGDQWSEVLEKMNGGGKADEKTRLILLALRNRQSEFMGMLVLVYAQSNKFTEGDQQQVLSFTQAFSGFAAVSLESRQLLKMQEDLLDSFIQLIAGAIDAKSPYTGGHCQRVPELTKMLAQAACDSAEGIFSDYQLNEDQWQEIHIASWLHDCGKVTTPEYVVDKSTKLETIYDRIHEIRMRFEVLKRDAEIRYWKDITEGKNKVQLEQVLLHTLRQLDEDFQFVAAANQGGEFMQEKDIQRLAQISQIRWMRTLDDKSGVSWEEKERMDKQPAAPLPVEEKLLDNKAHHIIERSASDRMPEDNPWGFKLDVPEFKFNRGELYNLSITKGTLSAEERFIINDHMVQTIKMLEGLPFPRFLKNIPLIAGAHHETLDGKGYPRRLSSQDMPLSARMMAIADIFEALTASDRPYKKAKTLSESLRILSFMRNDNHIDSDLFDLFLTSGVYLKYAEIFLSEKQIDDVDIQQYLSK